MAKFYAETFADSAVGPAGGLVAKGMSSFPPFGRTVLKANADAGLCVRIRKWGRMVALLVCPHKELRSRVLTTSYNIAVTFCRV